MPKEQDDLTDIETQGVGRRGEPNPVVEAQPEPPNFGATLRALRAVARAEAAAALQARGFALAPEAEERWIGKLTLPTIGNKVDVTVRLPIGFPDALPEVSVTDHVQFSRRIAHIEVSGKICFAPTSNLLLDADYPAELVSAALDLSSAELERGYTGLSDSELEAELLAYWEPTDSSSTVSICAPDGESRAIALCVVAGGPQIVNGGMLVADSLGSAGTWANRINASIKSSHSALFISVDKSVPLSAHGAATTVSQIRKLIERHATAAGVRLFHQAIKRSDYPQVIILSLPEATPHGGRRLVGVRIRRPDSLHRKHAAHGFRPGHIPPNRTLNMIGRESVGRLHLKRADHAFLTARGGVSAQLAAATVAVVGIGAVGSEVARNLAALGIGCLRLVDPDVLELANVHRHALGVHQVGANKSSAMAVELMLKFPHLDIQYRAQDAEAVLTGEPQFLLDASVIVLATGEETVERRLNRLLLNGPPRVHTWLEPLGLAGHAFCCRLRSPVAGLVEQLHGCFECLYRRDQSGVLFNRANLTAPGQDIRQSLAGCAGTFSPFSPLDARRTAVDAAELVARIISGAATTPILVTWRGLHTDFEANGHGLSDRAKQVIPGARVEIIGSELWSEDCSLCAAAFKTATDVQRSARGSGQ